MSAVALSYPLITSLTTGPVMETVTWSSLCPMDMSEPLVRTCVMYCCHWRLMQQSSATVWWWQWQPVCCCYCCRSLSVAVSQSLHCRLSKMCYTYCYWRWWEVTAVLCVTLHSAHLVDIWRRQLSMEKFAFGLQQQAHMWVFICCCSFSLFLFLSAASLHVLQIVFPSFFCMLSAFAMTSVTLDTSVISCSCS